MIKALLIVFIGGGLGSVVRYGISQVFRSEIFPYATLTANILSCLLLGFLIGLNLRTLLSSDAKLLLMSGFCGGFSTFSTFSGEIVDLYQRGELYASVSYMIISIISGLACILIGLYISKLVS